MQNFLIMSVIISTAEKNKIWLQTRIGTMK
jgi:hypothetical protein